MTTVRALPAGDPEPPGVVAKHIAGSLAAVDSWDVLLVLGLVFLAAGVGLFLGALLGALAGVGAALITSGALIMMGALRGASVKHLTERGG